MYAGRLCQVQPYCWVAIWGVGGPGFAAPAGGSLPCSAATARPEERHGPLRGHQPGHLPEQQRGGYRLQPFWTQAMAGAHTPPQCLLTSASPLCHPCRTTASPPSRPCLTTVSPLSYQCFTSASPLCRHCLATISPPFSRMSHHCVITASPLSDHYLTTALPMSHHCVTTVLPLFHFCLTSVSPLSHHCLAQVSPLCHHCLTTACHFTSAWAGLPVLLILLGLRQTALP